jgi:hypothetical protein
MTTGLRGRLALVALSTRPMPPLPSSAQLGAIAPRRRRLRIGDDRLPTRTVDWNTIRPSVEISRNAGDLFAVLPGGSIAAGSDVARAEGGAETRGIRARSSGSRRLGEQVIAEATAAHATHEDPFAGIGNAPCSASDR